MASPLRSALCLALLLGSTHAGPPPGVEALLTKSCNECHDADAKKGGLNFQALDWNLAEPKAFDRWVRVLDRVSANEMPPKDEPRPDEIARKAFLDSLGKELRDFSQKKQNDNGRTILRRLNRVEYENTVQDLLGISIPLQQMLPEDPGAEGFDTVATGLRISPLHLETYLEAADTALQEAIKLTKPPEFKKQHFSYKDEKSVQENLAQVEEPITDPKAKYNRKRQVFRDIPEGIVTFTEADYLLGLTKLRITQDGLYKIRFRGMAYQTDGQPIILRFYTNNYREKRFLGIYDIPADQPRDVEFTASLKDGEHLLLTPTDVGFDAKGQKLQDVDFTKDFTGRGLAMHWIEVEGPLGGEQWPPPSVGKLLGDTPVLPLEKNKIKNNSNPNAIFYVVAPTDPTASLKNVLENFLPRAFRRPMEPGEAEPFVQLATKSFDASKDFLAALQVGLRAVLTAPEFLLFDENVGQLKPHALANRLAYFLWSSPPDADLLQKAADGSLLKQEVLLSQVERMLADKRAEAFVTNFTGQWLDLRNIDATSPDSRLYPEYDEPLKRAMVGESQAFFREILQKDLPVTNFVQSDFLMLNSRIARHYDIPGVVGEAFRPVKTPAESVRGGLLTQAAVLKLTANGTTTSPVLRGAWVLKRILAEPPAPPPPNVGSIEPDTRGANTVRELLAKHRNSETCASCHQKIDPPGFAMEAFDVIGGERNRYRSKEKGDKPTVKHENRDIWQYKLSLPVDTTGTMSDGRNFKDIREFKALLLAKPEKITQALTKKLLTYGTGAGISFADRNAVESISGAALKQGNGLRTLIKQIVASEVFRSK